jgi:hypothetical protein
VLSQLRALKAFAKIHFVELEPPNARLFNSDGTAARRLNMKNSRRRFKQAVDRVNHYDSSKVYLVEAIYEACFCKVGSDWELLVNTDEL